jgi:hypothetical protein
MEFSPPFPFSLFTSSGIISDSLIIQNCFQGFCFCYLFWSKSSAECNLPNYTVACTSYRTLCRRYVNRKPQSCRLFLFGNAKTFRKCTQSINLTICLRECYMCAIINYFLLGWTHTQNWKSFSKSIYVSQRYAMNSNKNLCNENSSQSVFVD